MTSLMTSDCVAVLIQQDDSLEVVETLVVTLTSNDSAAILEPNKTEIMIVDDDGKAG